MRCYLRSAVPSIVLVGMALLALAVVGCNGNAAIERLSKARHLSSDLLVQFTKATDAANRAVMADTDDASVAFAREADQAKQMVRKDVDELQPILEGLGYSDEVQLLQNFNEQFGEYGELDRRILELAVENTNLKGQRLAFGPAREAADAFRASLEAVAQAGGQNEWRVKALAATAIARVREIQVLQAPHIADPDDAAMTRMEQAMAAAEAAARRALAELAPLVQGAPRSRLAAATSALDQLMGINAEITALSRRNTNVRSLALTLNEKGKLTASCEDSLRRLRDALAARGFSGTR
jgi:hypothetical protein